MNREAIEEAAKEAFRKTLLLVDAWPEDDPAEMFDECLRAELDRREWLDRRTA
jgi:hypothetical protein